ncbi:MAG: hypothetical protein U9P81_04240 [Euryarchaeota archaeon]|nr:hypothetical protein [Euryarchaeota archaeon]
MHFTLLFEVDTKISLSDALMSGFAMFSLKDPSCCMKTNSKTGEITYQHQMLGAAIVHPDIREVIPLAPEPIIKQDGESKNDSERNASKRFLEKLRKTHPHLHLIVIEDGLSSNAPLIEFNLSLLFSITES